MFANTGWRIGWAIGPQNLLWSMTSLLFAQVIAVPITTQEAFAEGIEIETERLNRNNSYFEINRLRSQRIRDKFIDFLREYNVDIVTPEGGYFIMANFTRVNDQLAQDLAAEPENRFGYKLTWMLMKRFVSIYV